MSCTSTTRHRRTWCQAQQDLVQNDHVYLVVNDSAIAYLSYRWLLDHDVPLIGGGFDGNYYRRTG